ncbi:MAG: hypothetical protein WCY10_05640 [Candidatus Omnitrophota bacterium]
MENRMEFNPVISKIKLNPEQAVLGCTCVAGRYVSRTSTSTVRTICTRRVAGTSRNRTSTSYCRGSATANFT